MKRILYSLLAILILGTAYLTAWPIPVAPTAWTAPKNAYYTGDFTPNNALADLERLPLKDNHGPEDAALWKGQIYTVSQDGNIIGIHPQTKTSIILTNTGGVPLGIEVNPSNGHLIVADAYKGLLSIAPSGYVTVLTNTVDGTPILYNEYSRWHANFIC